MRTTPRTTGSILPLFCLVFFLFSSVPLSYAHHPENAGVLLLFYGQKEAPYATTLANEFTRTIQSTTASPITFYLDSVDAITPGDPNNEKHGEALVTVLRQRYAHANIHVLVPIANEAIDFVKLHGREICPEASVVYMAMSFGRPTLSPPLPDATGAILHFDPTPTLGLALHQNPGTQHVVVIGGMAGYEQTEMTTIREQVTKYGGSLDFQFVTDVTYAEMLSRVAKLPPQSVILMLSFARDAAGDEFVSARVLPFVSRTAAAPVYIVYSAGIGFGAVGGQVHDFQEIGRVLGRLAAQVLSGVRAGDLPVVEGTFQRPMFDWQQLQRWNISEEQLPPGSVVMNRRQTLWGRYRLWILMTLAVVLLQAALIVSLVLLRIREHRVEQQLAAEKAHEELVAALAASFVHQPHEPVADHAQQGLQRLLDLHGLDRISVFELSDDGHTIERRYLHTRPTVGRMPPLVEAERVSWLVDRLLAGKPTHVSSPEELPEAARSTRQFLESIGVVSFASFPLYSEKRVIGALSFASLTKKVVWTSERLQELQTIANIFSTAVEREHVESTLQSTQELNGTVLDSLSSHLAVVDPRGVIIATNRSWRVHWAQNGGPNQAPATYLEVCQRWIPSSHAAQQALAGINAVLDGARDTFEMEYESATADRHAWFDMYVTPLLHSNGAVIRHLDITSRKTAELQLRESEARFRLIADSAPVMIWMSGTDKLCTYVNKVWLDFTGRILADELGHGWTDGIHPHDVERCLRTYDEAYAGRRAFTMEYRLRRADGHYRWVLDNGVPRHLADSTFAGYIGGCVDVTEQKESEEARSHLSGLLIGAQEQERTRIARELHDHINQRLALLAIELQQFEQSAANLNRQQKEGLERLWGETNDISHDVQALSHQLHSSQLQHLGLIAAVRTLCQDISKTGMIEAEVTSTGVPFKVDETIALAFFRVAQEALRNAGKYSGARLVEVELVWNAPDLSMAITDEGAGFEPGAASGSGLGLISMRERMRLVGGDLSVTSATGRGTRIEARVRLVSIPMPVTREEAPLHAERRKRARA